MRKLFVFVIVAIVAVVAVVAVAVTRSDSPQSAVGLSSYETVTTAKTFELGNQYQSYVVAAMCPKGKRVISGGYDAPLAGVGSRWGIDNYDGYIVRSGPLNNTWTVESYVKNKDRTKFTLRATAVCVKLVRDPPGL